MRYTLLPLSQRTAVETGAAFPVGERLNWTAKVRLAALTGGGSVTVVIESSPTAESTSWVAMCAPLVVNARGETAIPAWTTAWSEMDKYIRARVTSITGTVTFGVVADAPWFDTADAAHTALVRKELRDWVDGFQRTIDAAEAEVVSLIAVPQEAAAIRFPSPFPTIVPTWVPEDSEAFAGAARGYTLVANLTLDGIGDAMRREIARQAEHSWARERLSRDTSDATAQKTWRGMGKQAPNIGSYLKPFRGKTRRIFRGR